MCAACRKYYEKAKELVLWVLQDKDIYCNDEEMMKNLERLEYW